MSIYLIQLIFLPFPEVSISFSLGSSSPFVILSQEFLKILRNIFPIPYMSTFKRCSFENLCKFFNICSKKNSNKWDKESFISICWNYWFYFGKLFYSSWLCGIFWWCFFIAATRFGEFNFMPGQLDHGESQLCSIDMGWSLS